MPDIVGILTARGIAVADQRVPSVPRVQQLAGVMIHHTAAGLGSDLPSLRIVKYGRSDLPGPLCNVLIGRSGTVVAITDDYARDSGMGEREVLARALADLPVIGARHLAGGDDCNMNFFWLDIELENTGRGEPFSAEQIASAVAVTKALCSHHGWNPETRVIGHKESTSRKIDPNFDMAWFRRRVARHGPATPTEEAEDMTPHQAAQLANVEKLLAEITNGQIPGLDRHLNERHNEIKAHAHAAELVSRTCEALLRALVIETGVDVSAVIKAVREEIGDAVADELAKRLAA